MSARPSADGVNVFRQSGNPQDLRGFVWLLQDVQTKVLWRRLVTLMVEKRELFPVLVAFTVQDAKDYASAIPGNVPHAIVLMDDYYRVVVSGGDNSRSERASMLEVSEIERKYCISVMRGLILSDRHLGRDFMTGARGFATSKISKNRSLKTIHDAVITSFQFWEGLADKFPPTLALAYAGGAGLAGRPAALVLRNLKVPFRNMSFTRFGSRFYWADDEFATSDRFFLHATGVPPVDLADLKAVDNCVGVQVLTSNEMVVSLKKRKTFKGVIYRMCVSSLRHAYGYVRGYEKSRRGYTVLGTLSAIALGYLHQRWLDMNAERSLSSVADRLIVYHALQVEPELTVTLLGQFASDQLGLVREIALSIPANAVLVVKEHPWQVGSRDLAFYKQIKALPNVILIHPDYPSVDLIRRSSAVTTGSSSVVFEAAVLGIPAFHVMENSLLDHVPHVVSMRRRVDPEALRGVLLSTDSNETDRDRRKHDGAHLLKALLSFGFAFGAAGIVGRKAPMTEAECEEILADLDRSLQHHSVVHPDKLHAV